MPDQDPYADAATPAAAPEAPEPDTKTDAQEDGEGQTAEIPKAALGGTDLQPGTRVEMEVVQVNEDSVLVKVAGKEEAEPKPEAAQPQSGPMSSLME